MCNQWGTFTFASPQPKCWGDVSPPSPLQSPPLETYDRHGDMSVVNTICSEWCHCVVVRRLTDCVPASCCLRRVLEDGGCRDQAIPSSEGCRGRVCKCNAPSPCSTWRPIGLPMLDFSYTYFEWLSEIFMASRVQILVLVDAVTVTKVNFIQVGLKMPILLPFVVFEKFCPRSLTQYPTNS